MTNCLCLMNVKILKMKSNTADPMTEIPFFKFYIKVMFYFWREAGMHIYTTPNSKYTPKNNWF